MNDVDFLGKGYLAGKIEFLEKAQNLADSLDTYKQEIFDIRTSDAYALLDSHCQARLEAPQSYPEFDQLCPNAYLFSLSSISNIQKDYICAESQV